MIENPESAVSQFVLLGTDGLWSIVLFWVQESHFFARDCKMKAIL